MLYADWLCIEIKVRAPPTLAVPHRVMMNSVPICYMRRGAETVEMSLKVIGAHSALLLLLQFVYSNGFIVHAECLLCF